MKPVKAWAVQIDEDRWVVEYTRQDAKCRAELWRAYDGRKSRIVRVEIREVPPTRKRVTR